MEAWRMCRPVIRRAAGGYLALAPDDFPYRIGVTGGTVDQANRRFEEALARWRVLHERAAQDEGGARG